MPAFPGLIRTKELSTRPLNESPGFLESSPPQVEKRARHQIVDNPYFKSQNNVDNAVRTSGQPVRADLTLIDHPTPTSTPRLALRHAPISPPLLKRKLEPVESESDIADVQLSVDLPNLPVRSPSIPPSHSSAKDTGAVTDTDSIHALKPKPHRGLSDDNCSIVSGETRFSGSTTSRTKENRCCECKFIGHANSPLIKCSTCRNRFHANDKCINPKLCHVQCVSKGRTKVVATVPDLPAEEVSMHPPAMGPSPSSDAVFKSTSLLHVLEADHAIETGTLSEIQQPEHNMASPKAQGKPDGVVAVAPSSDPSNDLFLSKTRTVDMSAVPKEPAAMRDTSSSISHRLPSTHNLLDSYRPDHIPAPHIAARGHDVYRPPERPPRPPPIHSREEREKFLRHASIDEQEVYLRQHRKSICKEITCPHWCIDDCKHGDHCMYAHQRTGSYFPAAPKQSKAWTCFSWFDDGDCRDREDDCPFSHYDTGLYVGPRGLASTKHVTCFYWFHKDGACRKGADCQFAHYDTGILAADPSAPKRARIVINNWPSSPVRNSYDSWRPNAGTNSTAQSLLISPPPPVRDTPLSPISPSESDREEEYEPAVSRHTLQRDDCAASSVNSAHPQSQELTEPPSTLRIETPSSTAYDGERLQGAQLEIPGSSALPGNRESLNVKQTEEAGVVPVVHAIAPKQTARRTGGRKLHRASDPRRRKQAATGLKPLLEDINNEIAVPAKDDIGDVPPRSLKPSDPRLRKPMSSSLASILEPLPTMNDDEIKSTKPEVQSKPKVNHSALLPTDHPSILRCPDCGSLVLGNQAAKHKCQSTVSSPTSISEQPSSSTAYSKEGEVIDILKESHFSVQGVPKEVDPASEPDVTIVSDNMGHIFSRNSSVSTTPGASMHGPKRTLSGSGIDDVFIPNKKRKMVPPVVPRAPSSAVSPITAQAALSVLPNMRNPLKVSLSIEDLTELAALKKKYNYTEETQSDDDAVTLKDLRAKDQKKRDKEEARARQEEAEKAAEEAEEAAYKAKALQEKEKRDKAREEKLKKWNKEQEERRKKWEAEEQAEELAREAHDREAYEQRQRIREQLAQDAKKKSEGYAKLAGATPASASPNTSTQEGTSKSALSSFRDTNVTPTGRVSGEPHETTQELELPPFNREFSIFSPSSNVETALTSGPLPSADLQDGPSEQISTPKAISGLESASSDDGDIEHDETAADSAAASPPLGPEWTVCESCRERRIKCLHKVGTFDSSVNVDPPELAFKRPLNDGITQALKLTNPNANPVAFKVKTTALKQYSIRPNSGILAAGAGIEIRVVLDTTQVDHAAEIRCVDKLVFLSIGIPSDDANSSVWSRFDNTDETAVTEQKLLIMFLPADGTISSVNNIYEDPEEAPKAASTRNRACSACQEANRRCCHDPLSGEYDSARASVPPRKRSRVTPHSPRAASAPLRDITQQYAAPDPMSSSILASISATKTATDAFAQEPSLVVTSRVIAAAGTVSPGDEHANESRESHTQQPPLPAGLDPKDQIPDIPQVCADCEIPASGDTRLVRYGGLETAVCAPCSQRRYRLKTKKKRSLEQNIASGGLTADSSVATSSSSTPLDTISAVAGLEAARALAFDAITNSAARDLETENALASNVIPKAPATAPNSVAPDDILALFSQPRPTMWTHRAAAEPRSSLGRDNGYTGPRLVQSKVLSEAEQDAAVARLRAQGVEVLSASGSDLDSLSSWSGSQDDEAFVLQHTPLVKSARYEAEPDPRRWVDEVEDQKARDFDMYAAQKRIKARPGLKENVKALRNGTKPGKYLAMCDWRGRIRNYGSFHRECERDPGPQAQGTYIREVADRTKFTIPRGFDDQEAEKEEVQGTMQEFLGLPKHMKYDLTDSNRLVAARGLAFSDAVGRRVPDKDKYPVGKGG